jgi:hypothetical protein
MPDQLLAVLQRIVELQSLLKSFPLDLVTLAIGSASTITTLLMAPWDLRFERVRLSGITRTALAMVLSGLVAVCVLAIGLDAIRYARSDLPGWLDLALLFTCSLGFVAVVFLHLRNRKSFTFARFTNTVVIPLMAPVMPLFGVIQSAWSVMQ